MRRAFAVCASGLGILLSSCATRTWYARAPEQERSAHLAHQAIRTGMRLPDVVRVMMDVRGMGQLAELKSGPECPELRVNIVLHAGEMLAHVGSTRVYAGGFASIVMDS